MDAWGAPVRTEEHVKISPACSNVNARPVGQEKVVSWMSMNVWTTPVTMEEHVKIFLAPSNVTAPLYILMNYAVST